MPSLAETIIMRHLGRFGCGDRLLGGDGITTSDFTIKPMPQVLAGISVDAKRMRQIMPSIGSAISLAKNLDEYDSRICVLVGSLPDSDLKLQLQTFRIGIVASFAKLVELVQGNNNNGIAEWVKFATQLLEDASDNFLRATSKSGVPASRSRIASALAYFGTPEQIVEKSLKSYYGLE